MRTWLGAAERPTGKSGGAIMGSAQVPTPSCGSSCILVMIQSVEFELCLSCRSRRRWVESESPVM
ncbi:hypothetical protein EYF80_029831 [Liparis tanakae]|uniref:Uncharacterized protein n=1 Tax=Liparis tanakae TaxID=230148 RepID=A0A4Z2H2I9_9TELE|nr:hypothetical protein EYF80_029831 [Liparis tanakae]